jgi:hypothetical protein
MYNYSINTTYLDVENKDTQYRKEYLAAFNITEYNNEIIMNTVTELFQKYKNNTQIEKILELGINNGNKLPFTLDKETSFMMLFSYENFHLFHTFLKEINNTTNNDSYENIIKHLQKK